MNTYDCLVLGGGPGGYLAAERAAQRGMSVAVLEERAFGGVCLNEGCIPTKTLLHSAKMYRHATQSEAFGVTVEGMVHFSLPRAMERKRRVVQTLVGGVENTLKHAGVEMVHARGTVLGRGTNGLFQVAAGDEQYVGKRLIVASGSHAAVPPITGVREGLARGFVKTNREILEMESLPRDLVVIGGGVIGLEMACFFAAVGVKVTVIEMLDQIAGNTDAEIASVLQRTYEAQGMTFCLGASVQRVENGAVVYQKDGKETTAPCDMVLLSTGRRPNTQDIGLESINVQTQRGAIVTDLQLCTNVSGVWAVGDCNGKSMLAHTAYREAEVAVNHMCGEKDVINYDSVPAVIYTDPEVACVGMTLQGAKRRGYAAREVKVPMQYAGRYVAEVDNGKGFCKLVLDETSHRLLGVHMIGSYVSEMIYGAAMMIDTQLPPARLQKLTFPHPTVSEVLREALFAL